MKKNNFWKNKTVLLTGHTGFKGSWLTLILNNLGAKFEILNEEDLINKTSEDISKGNAVIF